MWKLKAKYEGKIILPDLTEDNIKVMEKHLFNVLEKYCDKV